MIYTNEEYAKLKKVASAFDAYIKKSPCIDIVWSDKFGYVVLGVDTNRGTADIEATALADAETLCEKLLYEIALDFFDKVDHERDICEAHPQERAEIERLQAGYMDQLPEYQHLIAAQFEKDAD